jgi:tRNA modification GTPase
VRAAVAAAAQGIAGVLGAEAGAPHELLCADLQRALGALSTVDGSHSPEDLLDRIFGRFCLGK